MMDVEESGRPYDHFRNPYYYIVVTLTWIGWVTVAVVGFALLMGWLPGLR